MGNTYKAIKSKHYIQNLIEEGEHEHQDFKYQISDARKIARSISAFANNSGGRLLIGVKDNGNIAGVESDEEIYNVLAEKIKEVNRVMPKYKAIRGLIISEEPLIKTTTNKIKRQANLKLLES